MTARRYNPVTWPLTLKVPLLVAVLMVGLAVGASNMVLMRLSESQKMNLLQLTSTYLDGLSTAVMPHVIRKDVWETFDVLDRAHKRYANVPALQTIVALTNGLVLAASDPRTYPAYSPAPEWLVNKFLDGGSLLIDEANGRAWAFRALEKGGAAVGGIFAEIDITGLLAERRQVLITLVVANTLMALLFVAVGYLTVRRMVRPVSLLTAYVERARDGKVELVPAERMPQPGTELDLLFRRFNAMAQALGEREALASRIAEEEKLVQLGKLASGMAHEVNNPLGGMLNAIDTLQKHGDDAEIRKTSLELLKRGLSGIRNVVRAALVTYKGVAEPRRLSRGELDDLRFLVQHEVSRRHLHLEWRNDLPDAVPVDGTATRQAVLNLILNACAASPPGGTVTFEASVDQRALLLKIEDDGPGLPEPVVTLFREPSVEALPPKGIDGLGTWSAARLVARMNGRFDVDTTLQNGTRLTIVIPVAREKQLNAVA